MPLAARLLIAFGLVSAFATGLVGFRLREQTRAIIEAGFQSRIEAANRGVRKELAWEAATLKGLLAPLCEHDTFVDRLLVGLEAVKGDVDALDPDRRIAVRYHVPDQATALKLDELYLVTGQGVVLGAHDATRIGTRDARLSAYVKNAKGSPPRFRPASAGGGEPSIEVHCARTSNGVTLGLVGARRLSGILERSGAYGVALEPADPEKPPPASDAETEVRMLDVPEVAGLRVAASMSRGELTRALATLDRAILATGAVTVLFASLIAVVLARSLSRPIVALARETREVVTGEPRQVRGRGGREIEQLAASFNRTIDELAAMRRRLAVTERIAARREVARQVAHEIKNPLAPIRAAVETLRRLRAREDPAFDEYFEEATSTVLQEVHRIANIVTEFTRFARLPPPKPERIDLSAVAKGVVMLHAAPPEGSAARPPKVELDAAPIPPLLADKDQMVQVLMNLVQNGLDAARAVREDPRVTVTIAPAPGDRVRIVVSDNGPGVSEAMLARLFEPYATTKDKGTGLGLAIAQRIVYEHGGEIAYRGSSAGAVFEILLPLSGPPPLEAAPPDSRIAP